MITFKYKNSIITTPNLEKKLKRMKITESDIEIIEVPERKEEKNDLVYPVEWYHYYKNADRWLCRITKNPEDEITFEDERWIYDKDYTIKEQEKLNEIQL